ncbi:MAG: DEAD/DEAH box helicase [Bryobacteraceae bacterium]
MCALELRRWQQTALALWNSEGHRGIISVVTGGGKTIFALACVASLRPASTLVVVPTVALLDQWWEEAANFFRLKLDEINVLAGSQRRVRPGTINLAVLNTASRLSAAAVPANTLLIVDECHKAAAPEFQRVLHLPHAASLGLSATPERPYDDGLEAVLVPSIGRLLFQYTYRDALADGVIVPFELRNVVFDLEDARQAEYDQLTKRIGRSIAQVGTEDPATVRLYLRRSRLLNLSPRRVELALRLVARHRGERVLVFHEDIAACDVIHAVLSQNGVSAGIYHSKLKTRERAQVLGEFRRGDVSTLVTCRALDEGFNVPEAEVGIIAASSATRRQRIQRLGRMLRPSKDKAGALVYTLLASGAEIARLKEEERELEGVATVTWGKA